MEIHMQVFRINAFESDPQLCNAAFLWRYVVRSDALTGRKQESRCARKKQEGQATEIHRHFGNELRESESSEDRFWPRAARQKLRLESTKLMAGEHVYGPDVSRFLGCRDVFRVGAEVVGHAADHQLDFIISPGGAVHLNSNCLPKRFRVLLCKVPINCCIYGAEDPVLNCLQSGAPVINVVGQIFAFNQMQRVLVTDRVETHDVNCHAWHVF